MGSDRLIFTDGSCRTYYQFYMYTQPGAGNGTAGYLFNNGTSDGIFEAVVFISALCSACSQQLLAHDCCAKLFFP